jgi:tetratricopeptide (TPR) repeat protein
VEGFMRWLLLALAIVLGALACYGWYWYTTPAPPRIELGADADPALTRAVEAAEEKVRREPRSAQAWGDLGQLLLAHAHTTTARPCLVQAERLDPANPVWPYLQAWGDLLDDPQAAVPCLRRALERCEPDSERAQTIRLRLAQTLFERGEQDEAEEQFRRLLSTQPGNPLVHLGLGSIALARGNLDNAVEHLRQCADSPYSQQKACAHLAVAYRRLQQNALADQFDRQARALPKDAEWTDPLAAPMQELVVGRQARFIHAERAHRQGSLPQSAEQFRALLHDYPDDSKIMVKLGMVLVEMGDYPAAEQVLRQAIASDPNKVQAHFFLSAALFHQAERRGKDPAARALYADAASAARAALDLQPNHGLAFVYLGLSLRHLDKMDAALDALTKAVRCSPESVEPHLHLGETLLLAGRRAEGIRELEDAAQVAPPSDVRARKALERARAESP